MTRQNSKQKPSGPLRLARMFDIGRVKLRAALADPAALRALDRAVAEPGQWWALVPEPGPVLRWVRLAGRGWPGVSKGRLVALGLGGETMVAELDAQSVGPPLRLPESCAGVYLWLPPHVRPPRGLAFWRLGTAWALARLALPQIHQSLRSPRAILSQAKQMRQRLLNGNWRSAKSRFLQGLLQREIYADWVSRHDTLSPQDRTLMARRVAAMPRPPLISVVMPVFNPPPDCLAQALASLRGQIYPHWELCAADDASDDPKVRAVLDKAAQDDPRVRVVHRPARGHISEASNSALAIVRGDYVALMDHDDILPPHALYLVAEEILAHPEADIIYSDEDKIDEQGLRFGAYFKPDWDPELFLGQNMISHLGVYRRGLLDEIGGFRRGLEGSQDYDLCLRALERSSDERVRHIPRVLYHWRAIASSTASGGQAKAYAFRRAHTALSQALARRGVAAQVEIGPNWGQYRVHYDPPDPLPTISLVAPLTDEGPEQTPPLAGLLQGLAPLTGAWDLEVIAVGPAHLLEQARAAGRGHPGVPLRLVEAAGSWPVLVNAAADLTQGSILGLVDPGLAPSGPAWLEEAAALLAMPGNGALGGFLLQPDGTVLQAGLTLRPGRVAAPVNHGDTLEQLSGFMRHTTRQRLSAVSGACLFTRREVFQRLGGLDQEGLARAYADVDYCLRLRREGLAVVWAPRVRLELAQAASGGPLAALLDPQGLGGLADEAALMERRWGKLLAADPYHNPNVAYGSMQQNPVAPRGARPWESGA
ncbi:MAG: glycosyltransferase [Proteobacteria bacterium]|nr:glycosyltransferase [Pseudomonadota bacterium]MCG2764571.1 glycosyltransferase [Desulfarculaceae bacterium]